MEERSKYSHWYEDLMALLSTPNNDPAVLSKQGEEKIRETLDASFPEFVNDALQEEKTAVQDRAPLLKKKQTDTAKSIITFLITHTYEGRLEELKSLTEEGLQTQKGEKPPYSRYVLLFPALLKAFFILTDAHSHQVLLKKINNILAKRTAIFPYNNHTLKQEVEDALTILDSPEPTLLAAKAPLEVKGITNFLKRQTNQTKKINTWWRNLLGFYYRQKDETYVELLDSTVDKMVDTLKNAEQITPQDSHELSKAIVAFIKANIWHDNYYLYGSHKNTLLIENDPVSKLDKDFQKIVKNLIAIIEATDNQGIAEELKKVISTMKEVHKNRVVLGAWVLGGGVLGALVGMVVSFFIPPLLPPAVIMFFTLVLMTMLFMKVFEATGEYFYHRTVNTAFVNVERSLLGLSASDSTSSSSLSATAVTQNLTIATEKLAEAPTKAHVRFLFLRDYNAKLQKDTQKQDKSVPQVEADSAIQIKPSTSSS